MKSEEVTLLRPDEYQSSQHLGDLGNLPRDSNDEDRLQTHTKRIRIQKYLREKLLYHRIKCIAVTFLAAFMWRRLLNSAVSTNTVHREGREDA